MILRSRGASEIKKGVGEEEEERKGRRGVEEFSLQHTLASFIIMNNKGNYQHLIKLVACCRYTLPSMARLFEETMSIQPQSAHCTQE